MKFIGITGGIGAGKSRILKYLRETPGVMVYEADVIGKELMTSQSNLFPELQKLFAGEDVFRSDGEFDIPKLSAYLFSHPEVFLKEQQLIHAGVKETILSYVDQHRRAGDKKAVFFEAALLIEGGYHELCDELWYIYADQEIRKKRLMEGRNMSPTDIKKRMDAQLSHEQFLQNTEHMIDNSGDFSETKKQLQSLLAPILENA